MGPTSSSAMDCEQYPLDLDFEKKKSSYKGHRVDALVLEGDEGRDKLR